MKIAYLANVRFPSERAHAAQIFHMCKAFSENGADLTLFVNKINKTNVDSIKNYFASDFNFKIQRLTRGPFLPKFKPSYYLGEVIFSISFLMNSQRKNFDIIYSRHEWVLWFLSSFINPSVLVWESHEAKLNFPARVILRGGVRVICISDGIYEDYEKFGVPKSQMLVAHDGIDDSFFGAVENKQESRKRLKLPEGKKIVMYIGGFDTWKGIETFLGASEICSDTLFVAIGGKNEEVAPLSAKYPRVTFLGQRPYSELKDNQQAADVLVIPNTAKGDLSSRYTSPLKLFAHMASGIPLVVSNVPSITVVTGRDSVVVVNPDDSNALAEGIQSIFSQYKNRKMLAQELQSVSSCYTWKKRAKKILFF